MVGPDLAVNLDQPLLHDGSHLLHGEGVVKPVPQEEGDGHGLPHLVWARAGLAGENTAQLGQHP